MKMQRTIVPQERYFSEELTAGVFHEKFYPGGKDGPNGEVHQPLVGGQTWSESIFLGSDEDAFQTLIPDIRMPANQYWPLHWHDCWTLVLVLEGGCRIGDWWLGEGDIFLTVPSLEYGPMVVGPEGCRMWEVFAQGHLCPGGYAPEYHDHPTLEGSSKVFLERSELNKRNEGRQILPCEGVEGIWKLKLEPGKVFDLGETGDPERSVIRATRLAPGETVVASTTADWRMMAVLGGSIECGGRMVGRDGYLRIAPGAALEVITAGSDGADLIEIGRTAKALPGLS
ncbi:MAG: hypothetical protein QM676_06765 [Novosphingobium sp.]